MHSRARNFLSALNRTSQIGGLIVLKKSGSKSAESRDEPTKVQKASLTGEKKVNSSNKLLALVTREK